MSGRTLFSDEEAVARGFGGREAARRREVLRETLAAFEQADPPDRHHRLAALNLDRWRARRGGASAPPAGEVHAGDWGEVTRALTREHGACFAVLNMANAHVPGGGYVEGAAAQEENMFRRTDCHFRIGEEEYDARLDGYRPATTRLLEARYGMVYLDVEHPRVCIRGAEDRSRPDLGYPWLPENEVFPFLELRAAAQDLRDGSEFDADDARRRIAAQLNTLRARAVRHVVLGAFGCGAFRNPAERVAQIYADELGARATDFSVVAFAIYAAGYGPDNYGPFAEVFRRRPRTPPEAT